MTLTSTDVVVLGAGAIGCATAYFLARDGLRVTVVEKEGIASGASGYALGLLNPLHGTGIPGPVAAMAQDGYDMHQELWPALQEESGVDIQASMMPQLELCLDEAQADDLKKEIVRWDATDGFSARWLEPGEARRLEPRITEDLVGAVLLENLGSLDSYRFTLALAQAAEHHGARFVSGEVIGLGSAGGRVTSAVLGRGEVPCDAVVVAMGPWSSGVSDWLGIDVPVEPLKGQMIHLEGMNPPLEYCVYSHCFVVQKGDGLVWIGATEEETGFDDTTTSGARNLLMEQALRQMPGLADLGFLRQTACLRPVTPDYLPLLGRVPGWEGVYLATGAEKKGILIGPPMGRAAADLVLNAEVPLSIAPFALDRFL